MESNRKMPKRKKTRWETLEEFERRKRKQIVARGFQPSIGRGPLARTMKVTMRYQSSVAINPAAGVTAVHVFAANGMYDPNITGIGHQPRGFDQLMALYDHYVVIGAKITMDVVPGANETVGMEAGISLRDSSAVDVANGYIEGGNTEYKISSPTAGYPCRIVMKCNPNKFLGRSRPLADAELKGSATQNLTEMCFFHCWARSSISSEEPGTHCACVMIEFTAILIEPIVPAQS